MTLFLTSSGAELKNKNRACVILLQHMLFFGRICN